MSDRPDLEEIERRAEQATEGPWEWQEKDCRFWSEAAETRFTAWRKERRMSLDRAWDHPEAPRRGLVCRWGTDYDDYGFEPDDVDADFIAHARTDIPALLAYVRELEGKVRTLQRDVDYLDRLAGGKP